MINRVADAEQAKQTGAMVALYPRQDFAEAMVVEGGEPIDDLHCTLAYIGEDVSDMPREGLLASIGRIADALLSAVNARVMGHAIFNPDGGESGEQDPCCVYLLGDSDLLMPLRDAVVEACEDQLPSMHPQHEPVHFHVTAAYAVQRLSFVGPIVFDRLSVNWQSEQFDFPLMDIDL